MSLRNDLLGATTGKLKGRTLEWWGAGLAVFVQTGAVTGYGSLRKILLILSFAIIGAAADALPGSASARG